MTKVNTTPTGVTTNSAESPDIAGLGRLLKGIGEFPEVLKVLEDQSREIRALREDVRSLGRSTQTVAVEGWLDAKDAAAYLSMSAGTFDKYRYETSVKIKGYKVGGKTLYKKADLDAFVMLYEARSEGPA